MDNEQFTLIFNAVCFFISVAAAIVSGFSCIRTLKDAREEEKKEKERELSANRDGDDFINPTDSKL